MFTVWDELTRKALQQGIEREGAGNPAKSRKQPRLRQHLLELGLLAHRLLQRSLERRPIVSAQFKEGTVGQSLAECKLIRFQQKITRIFVLNTRLWLQRLLGWRAGAHVDRFGVGMRIHGEEI